MKKFIFALLSVSMTLAVFSQDDEYQKFIEAQQKQMKQQSEQYQKELSDKDKEYKDFVAKQNAEFAEFVAKEWALFEDFKRDNLAMTMPKIEKAPVAQNTQETIDVKSSEVSYSQEEDLPKVTHSMAVAYEDEDDDNYEVRSRIGKDGAEELPTKDFDKSKKFAIDNSSNLLLNFYGRQISIAVDPKLKFKSTGIEEKEVADYFSKIAKCGDETHALWTEITKVVNDFGLNEWGYFCLVREVSEKMFDNVNDRSLFCFYMLRNEGGFKARLARGKVSGSLTLLIALDNSKEVYSYTYVRFADDETGTKKVKYYTVYGGGKANEAVYSYDFCKQDTEKKQMRLDFDKILNMGECDVNRTLKLTKDKNVTLPYNKAHMAYLNDVT